MNTPVEAFEIDRVARWNHGVRPEASHRFIKLKKGPPVRRPIESIGKAHPYSIDERTGHLYFIETDVAVDHNRVAFIYEAVQANARRLLKVPVEEFIRYTAGLKGHEGDGVVFIYHPGRCGSTLLHQLLGSHPQIDSYSEHLILNNIEEMNDEGLKDRLFKATVAFVVAQNDRPGERYTVFKLAQRAMCYERYGRLFPNARHIYLTRDAIAITKSLFELSNRVKLFRVAWRLKLPWLPLWGISASDMIASSLIAENETVHGMRNGKRVRYSAVEGVVMSVLVGDSYFEKRRDAKKVTTLRYEQIVTLESLRDALEQFLGVDLTQIDTGLYQRDSQKGSIAEIQAEHRMSFTEKEVARLRSFIERMTTPIPYQPSR